MHVVDFVHYRRSSAPGYSQFQDSTLSSEAWWAQDHAHSSCINALAKICSVLYCQLGKLCQNHNICCANTIISVVQATKQQHREITFCKSGVPTVIINHREKILAQMSESQ